MKRFLSDNGLSIAFFCLFAVCIAGAIVSGYRLQIADPLGQPHPSSVAAYLASADFLKAIFSNWQAAILQLLVLIVLSVFLRQRGASHSKKDRSEPKKGRRQSVARFGLLPGGGSWTYRNSLSLAFLGLFLLCFAVFFFSEGVAFNAERTRHAQAPLSFSEFAISAKFWFATFQTWQAEFFAMGVFLVLSIRLRQEGSAESKPVEASDDETGETNE